MTINLTFLIKRLFIFIVITLIYCKIDAICINQPQFYKANYLAETPSTNQQGFATNLEVRYAFGSTRNAFGRGDKKHNILSIWGETNVSIMGINVEGLDPITTPVAYTYLNPTTGIIPGYNFQGQDGKISLHGKFKMNELDLDWSQNILLGLYLHAYLPIKWLQVRDVKIVNHTSPSNPNAAAFQTFLNNDFETALAEFGIRDVTRRSSENGLGDFALYVGWQDYNNRSFGKIIRDLSCCMEIGIIVPSGKKANSSIVTSLPTGYNGHLGFSARAAVEIGVLTRYLILGAFGGADVFQSTDHRLKLRTDTDQVGLIFLQGANVDIRPGSIWTVGAYIKFEDAARGFSGTFGYSFAQRERTKAVVKDKAFLRTYLDNLNPDTVNAPTQDSVIKYDPRFASWNQNVFHFLVNYDFAAVLGCSRATPNLSIFYDYPFEGRRVWTTSMIGGKIGACIMWVF